MVCPEARAFEKTALLSLRTQWYGITSDDMTKLEEMRRFALENGYVPWSADVFKGNGDEDWADSSAGELLAEGVADAVIVWHNDLGAPGLYTRDALLPRLAAELVELQARAEHKPSELCRIAVLVEQLHTFEESLPYWEKAAEAGDYDAIEYLARLEGEGP